MDTAKGDFRFTIFKGDRNTILGRILLMDRRASLVFPLYLYDITYLGVIAQDAPMTLLKGKMGEFECTGSKLFLLEINWDPNTQAAMYRLNSPFTAIPLSGEQARLFAKVFQKLFNGYQKSGSIPMQKLYFSMLLQLVVELLAIEKTFTNREEALARDFLKLVTIQSYPEHRVNFYAEKLFVSRRYLTKAVHNILGMTPKSIIDKRIIEVSKKLLSKEDPIYSIAEELRFESPTSFTTFFKKHTGYSPSQYRNLNTP